MGFFIPEEFKKMNNWLVWDKYKKPYNPKTGIMANALKNCADYETAAFTAAHNDKYKGVGFWIQEGQNLTCIDLDHVIDDSGNIAEWAQAVIDEFSDCYIEYSQSETGLHIFCKAAGFYVSSNKTGIEIYSRSHYIAMTGKALNRNEPQEAQERVERLYNSYNLKNAVRSQKAASQGHTSCSTAYTIPEYTGSPEELAAMIERIKQSRQGAKWMRLHSGNILGYHSRNEAWQAYINITNYFTGGNDVITKAIAIQSGFSELPDRDGVFDEKYKLRLDDILKRSIKKAKLTAQINMKSDSLKDRTNYRKITFSNASDIPKQKRKTF